MTLTPSPRLLLALSIGLFLPHAGNAQEPPLTIERILAQPSLTGTAPSAPAWSADSRSLAFLWNDAALPRREIWIVDGDGAGLRRVTSDTEGTGWAPQHLPTQTSYGREAKANEGNLCGLEPCMQISFSCIWMCVIIPV